MMMMTTVQVQHLQDWGHIWNLLPTADGQVPTSCPTLIGHSCADGWFPVSVWLLAALTFHVKLESPTLGVMLDACTHTPVHYALTKPGDSHGNISNFMWRHFDKFFVGASIWIPLCPTNVCCSWRGTAMRKSDRCKREEYLGSVLRGTTNTAGDFL